MATLGEKLDSLGLAPYHAVLADNGFDEWDTVLDITDEDMSRLGFTPDHQRLLQREIAASRSGLDDKLLSPAAAAFPDSSSSSSKAPRSPAVDTMPRSPRIAQTPGGKRAKRRYRWHARPDPNAPKRPKTAYVNFADRLRTDPAIAGMSFVEIAREVGRQWQTMEAAQKHEWENEAAVAMHDYEEQMEAYRKTDPHQEYQRYLESFKKAPGKTARQTIRKPSTASSDTHARLRRSESMESIGSRDESTGSMSERAGGAAGSSLEQECQYALALAMAEIKWLKKGLSDVQPYDLNDFPAEGLVRLAVLAFVDGSGSLLHVLSREQAEQLLKRTYQPNAPPDMLAISEMCVVAALGGHYDSQQIPHALTRKLIASALVFLGDVCVKEDTYLRIMRLFLCLAIYSLLEQHRNARHFISTYP